MTDDPLDPRDELASAHLDGTTSAEEAAQVAADPELRARVDRLAAARDALRATDGAVATTADVERRREAGIAAALAAYDDEAAAPAAGATLATVPAVRRLRAAEPRRTWQLIGIAAAVLLLALAVPLLGSLDDGSDDDTSDVALEAAPEESTAERATESASPMAGDEAGAGSVFDASEGALPRLGSFEDLTALVDALAEQRDLPAPADDAVATTTTPADADSQAAAAVAAAPCGAVGPGATSRWIAELEGQEVVVLVFDQPDGSASVIVVEAIGCAVVGRTDVPAPAGG